MGFFFTSGAGTATKIINRPSNELLHELGCRACPLNKAEHILSPKMLASGSTEPLIYVLAEGPGKVEDEKGKQLVGPSGEFFWDLFPRSLLSEVRRNNVVNCRTSLDDRTPEKVEVECCRPRVERDIEQTKPAAIFGLGGVPLAWADKPSGIKMWHGRRFPIQVLSHACWYYPMYHPAFILHLQKDKRMDEGLSARDYEVAFKFYLNKAIKEVRSGLPKPVIHTPEFVRKDITCIYGRSKNDLDYVIDFLEYAGRQESTGVDYETQNNRPYYKDSIILTIAVSTFDETLSFAWEHPQSGWSPSQLELLREAWTGFLKSTAKKYVHGLAFEIEWTCYFYGKDYARGVPWEDTMTQAFVLDERVGDIKPGALALEFITLQNFGINIKSLTPGLNKRDMKSEPLNRILPYNGIDAKYHLLNGIFQEKRIVKEDLVFQYQEKLRQVPTCVLTQMKGVPVDVEENKRFSEEYDKKVSNILFKIKGMPEVKQYKRLTNEEFNPGSPQDVHILLKDVLKTREGQEGAGWTTNKATLNRINEPITKAIVEYREAVKLRGTYVAPYSPGSPHLYDGNILHQQLGTCFTESGRLQSEDPNMQNIPIRNTEGKKVRKQIKAKYILSCDYGQIDGRGIACESRDKVYCKALWTGYDVHAEWARRLASHYPDFVGGKKYIDDVNVLDKFRNKVKGDWTFALFYGAALSTTAGRFGVSEDILKPIYKEFWRTFTGVAEWQERILKDFSELGYVQLSNGLRRRVPLSRGQVVNTPIQGATNRIIMDAMNRLSEIGDWRLQANMQIHDDLKFFFDNRRDFEECLPIIVKEMLDLRTFDWICVPIVIEASYGSNLAEMEKIDVYESHKILDWPKRAKEFM